MEEFTYDDQDGSFSIEVGDEECTFRYETNGDLNNFILSHCPHDLQSFYEFLFAAARECQAEFGRQEMEAMKGDWK